MKVILVNPPTLVEIPSFLAGVSYTEWTRVKSGGKEYYQSFPGEHLGLQYLTAFLRDNGHCVEIVDGCVENHRSVKDTIDAIDQHCPFDLIGFTGPYSVFSEILLLAQNSKKKYPKVPIIYGNVFASLNYQEILKKYACFDYVCVGEGELSLLALIKALEDNSDIVDVPSIAYRCNNEVVLNRGDSALQEVINLRPARDNASKTLKNGFSITMLASRGCPYRCSFCTTASMSRKFKRKNWILRDPFNFVDELEMLVNVHQIDRLSIIDDTFAVNSVDGREQAKTIAKEIIRRGLKLSIMVDTRIDSIDYELFNLLRDAGLKKVYLGIESGSSSSLKLYQKGYGKEDIVKGINVLHELGIGIVPGFIVFQPEVTVETLRSSAEIIKSTRHYDPSVYSFELVPYPGVIITEEFRQKGNVVGEFPDYQLVYQEPTIVKIKQWYDKLKIKYLLFMISSGQKKNNYKPSSEINDFFYEYFMELVDEYESLVKTSCSSLDASLAEVHVKYEARLIVCLHEKIQNI